MCACITNHPGFSCSSNHCDCHQTSNDDAVRKEANVYVNITFTDVSRDTASHILRVLTDNVGLISYSVFVDDVPDNEEEE